MSFKNKIPSIIAYILIVVGFLVIIGWIFDITFFKSVIATWYPMRFVTAICFIMSGLIILALEKSIHNEYKNSYIVLILLSIASLVTTLLMAFLLASKFFGIEIDIEDILIGTSTQQGSLAALSLATAINFILISMTGIMAMFNLKKLRIMMMAVGIIVGFIGLFGVFGYIFGIPFLYFSIGNISAPMAVHTTVLFFLAGISFYLLGEFNKNNMNL